MWVTLLFTVAPGMIVVTASMSLTVVAIMHLAYPTEAADPFAPYEMFLPGQPVTEHALQLCFMPAGTETTSCRPEPGRTPYIQWVTVAIREGVFRQIWFTTTDITIGDVVHRWGHPRVVGRNSRQFFVRWKGGLGGVIRTPGYAGRFSYLLPVEMLTIGIEPLTPSGG